MTLDEFYIELGKLKNKYTWYTDIALRTENPNTKCPLTAVCYEKGLGDYPIDLFCTAAEKLLIKIDDTFKIQQAADNYPKCDKNIRENLIKAITGEKT